MAIHPYTLQRNSRSRSIRLKVTAKAEVIVVAPPRVPQWQIDQFVKAQQSWLEKALAKTHQKLSLHDPDMVEIFGKKYPKIIDMDPKTKLGVKIKNQTVVITPVSNTATSIERSLNTFFKTTAEKYIVPRTRQLATKMKTTYGNLTLREQQTRWGSCSSQGNLNFNWRLVHSPPAVIDYVIVHELAHRTHMNHSAAFWELVGKFDPEYLKHRGWLKRQGLNLG